MVGRMGGEARRLLALRDEHVAIRASRAADDVPLVAVKGIAGGGAPGGVVGHRALHAEHAAVLIGNDRSRHKFAGVPPGSIVRPRG